MYRRSGKSGLGWLAEPKLVDAALSSAQIAPARQPPLCYAERRLVGLGGLEPPTSPLSGVRSSHLSYRPNVIDSTQYFIIR